MKLKFLSVVLAALMLLSAFSLFSCVEKAKTPYELMVEAQEKAAALGSMHVEMVSTAKVEVTGMTLETEMEYDIKAADMTTENPLISMDMTMEMMGEKIAMTLYMDSKDAYLDMGELGQFKTSVSEMMEDYDAMGNIADTVKIIPEEMMEGVVATDNEDGTKTIAVTLSDEQFNSVFADMVDEMAASAAGVDDAEGLEIKLSNCRVEMVIAPDGYFAEYNMAFDMDMTIMGMKASAKTENKIKYIEPGKTVTVTPPEGYESFPEMDASLLG